ncbi:hypothetical protein E2562_029594 [Oryza meyeriana var. granulata]|uniref:Uncharacterized protein n=1 Tax=Oryza meyeriana var. granulata TaxID=110450 RepID=A0A6G1E3X2_9ORYZ|nr:hypothetical protein E2562_029594 [Oryza meyeriana var. granulata]
MDGAPHTAAVDASCLRRHKHLTLLTRKQLRFTQSQVARDVALPYSAIEAASLATVTGGGCASYLV